MPSDLYGLEKSQCLVHQSGAVCHVLWCRCKPFLSVPFLLSCLSLSAPTPHLCPAQYQSGPGSVQSFMALRVVAGLDVWVVNHVSGTRYEHGDSVLALIKASPVVRIGEIGIARTADRRAAGVVIAIAIVAVVAVVYIVNRELSCAFVGLGCGGVMMTECRRACRRTVIASWVVADLDVWVENHAGGTIYQHGDSVLA